MNDFATLRQTTENYEFFWVFLIAQSLWMLLAWGVIQALGVWTLNLYFISSFFGLLFLRLLFAPTDYTPTWWSRLNLIVYAGFVALAYIFYNQLLEFM